MPPPQAILDLLHTLRRHGTDSVRLDAIAARSGWSPFHVHRAFRALVGETPKRYTQRLVLERAAARLAATHETVLDVALWSGFSSHEVFTRAFRRQFGRTPVAYRTAARASVSAPMRESHTRLVESSGPCIGLYHVDLGVSHRRSQMPILSIERRDLSAQPFLFVRRKAGRHEIAAAIAEGLGKAFPYVMQAALPIAGRPTVRYLTSGPGLFDMQIGVPVAGPSAGEGEVEAGELPGGAAAVAVHAGPYDQLGETYAAMERWMEANGCQPGGAPWEAYVTDPGEHPDPSDWRTEIYWPMRG